MILLFFIQFEGKGKGRGKVLLYRLGRFLGGHNQLRGQLFGIRIEEMKAVDQLKPGGGNRHALSQKCKLEMKQSTYCTTQERSPSTFLHPTPWSKIHQNINKPSYRSLEWDEETILFNHRKSTISIGDNHEDILNDNGRQLEMQANNGHQSGSRTQRKDSEGDCATTYRKHKIFSTFRVKREVPSKEEEKEVPVPTARARNRYTESGLLGTGMSFKEKDNNSEREWNHECLVSPIKMLSSMPNRTNSVERVGRLQLHHRELTPVMQCQDPPIKTIKSPVKITFTYQDSPRETTRVISKKKQSERIETPKYKVREKGEEGSFASLAEEMKPYFRSIGKRQEEGGKNIASKVKKDIFPIKPIQSKPEVQGLSWGNKIRTELMAVHKEQAAPPNLVKTKQSSSKVSLAYKQNSAVLKHEKIDSLNLKLADSHSNLEVEHNSNRYFDEDCEFLPQIKKISYNDIDFSRDQSFDFNHEIVQPNELIVGFATHSNDHKFAPLSIKRTDSRLTNQVKTSAPPILGQLDCETNQPSELKSQTKPRSRFDILLPAFLISMACMLLLIQISF